MTTTEPAFSSFTFSRDLQKMTVRFSVLKMKDSFLLWIGDERAKLDGLAVGMAGVGGQQLCSSLIAPGNSEGLLTERLVAKLSKRTGVQVFLSLSLDEAAAMERFGDIEAAVMEELAMNPDRFIART